MNILLVNWQDRENPQAGGAEIHLLEIFGRLAAKGHECGWSVRRLGRSAEPRAMLDGIEVYRSRHAAQLSRFWAAGPCGGAIRAERPDVLVEDINKLPLYPAGKGCAFCAIVPHLFGETVFQEAAWPLAAAVWLAERPLPYGYRTRRFMPSARARATIWWRAGFHPAMFESFIRVWTARSLTPDPAGARTAAPTFLYVGRLKRYKGVEYAIRALAIARRTQAGASLGDRGGRRSSSRIAAAHRELGQDEAVDFRGFVTEEDKLSLLRSSWANVFPSPKEGWGITVVEAAACGTPPSPRTVRGFAIPCGMVRQDISSHTPTRMRWPLACSSWPAHRRSSHVSERRLAASPNP